MHLDIIYNSLICHDAIGQFPPNTWTLVTPPPHTYTHTRTHTWGLPYDMNLFKLVHLEPPPPSNPYIYWQAVVGFNWKGFLLKRDLQVWLVYFIKMTDQCVCPIATITMWIIVNHWTVCISKVKGHTLRKQRWNQASHLAYIYLPSQRPDSSFGPFAVWYLRYLLWFMINV